MQAAAAADLAQLPLPPGSWKRLVPLLGETLDYAADPVQFVNARSREHGPVFRSHLFGEPMVVVAGLDAWKQLVVVNEFTSVSMYFVKSMRKLINNPQDDISSVEDHTAMRRRWAPAFAPSALATYLRLIDARINLFLERWADLGAFELQPTLEHLTFGFASELVVGLVVDEETENELVETYCAFGQGLVALLPYNIPGLPFWRAMRAREKLLGVIKGHVAALRESMAQEDARGRHSLLYHSMVNSEDADDDQLAMKTLQLIIAGHDTTRSGLGVLLTLLPQLPGRVLQRLAEEQRTVVRAHGPGLTVAALADMHYCEATVNECLRLVGPGRGVLRRATQDLELGGYRVAAGSIIFASVDGAHLLDPVMAAAGESRHMDVGDLGASFQPERWLSEETRPAAFMPFGAGAHTCLGKPLYYLEAKALLAQVVRRYDVQLVSGPVEWLLLPFPQPTQPTIMRVARKQQPLA